MKNVELGLMGESEDQNNVKVVPRRVIGLLQDLFELKKVNITEF